MLRVLSLNVVTDCRDSAYVTPTRAHPAPRPQMLQRLAHRCREPGRRGVVVGQQRLLRRGDVGAGAVGRSSTPWPGCNRSSASNTSTPTEIGLLRRYGSLNPEAHVARQVADVRVRRQRLAQTQEVVGRVVQPDERARQTADAAVHADRVLALSPSPSAAGRPFRRPHPAASRCRRPSSACRSSPTGSAAGRTCPTLAGCTPGLLPAAARAGSPCRASPYCR